MRAYMSKSLQMDKEVYSSHLLSPSSSSVSHLQESLLPILASTSKGKLSMMTTLSDKLIEMRRKSVKSRSARSRNVSSRKD